MRFHLAIPALLMLASLGAQQRRPQPELPFAFVENGGQWQASARYRATLGPLAAWVLADGWRLQWHGQQRGVVLEMRFLGAREQATVTGLEPREARHNWLLGADPEGWVTGVRSYGRVRFRSLYEGVDVELRRQDDHLEYDLLLQPGADLGLVRVRWQGIEGLRIDSDGALVADTAAGPLRQPPPATWAVTADGSRRPVAGRFVVRGADQFGFAVDGWDGSEHLVVDPGLLWSSHVGGSGVDRVNAVAVAPDGETAVAGATLSSDLPVTTGVLQPGYVGRTGSQNGDGDAFVARLSADGSQLRYVTYLGGNGGDEATGVALAADGVVTVGGWTWSTDFPTTASALRRVAERADEDVFAARLDASGTTLLYGTYFGGRRLGNGSGGTDKLSGLSVNEASGWIYLSGWTTSTAGRHLFPVTANAFQSEATVHAGFLAILDLGSSPGNTVLQYSSFVGGTGHAVGTGPHHVDSAGVVTLCGVTQALDHPTTNGAFRATRPGPVGGFVTRIDPAISGGAGLVYSTYLGGSGPEENLAAATDSSGAVTVAGTTRSQDFPVTAGAFQATLQGGSRDGFVVRLDPSATGANQLLYGSYLAGTGGCGEDYIHALAIADGGIALVGGDSNSQSFPTTPGAFQRAREKGGCASYGFLGLFDLSQAGAQSLLYCTAVEGCGTQSDKVRALHYDHASRTATVGGLAHEGFVVSPGAAQTTFGGGQSDGFVTRLELLPVTSTVAFGQGCAGTVGVPVLAPDLDAQLCNLYRVEFQNMPPNQILLVCFGWSRTQHQSLPLPLDLTPFGLTNCTLYVSADIVTFTTTSSGTRGYRIVIPGDPRFLGMQFHNQGIVLDPGANPADLITTNAVEAVVRW